MAVILNNTGRLVQQIPGITGVNAGGLALVNLPVNARYHRLKFFSTSGGVASTAQLTALKLLVNGINMRDITPVNTINIAKSVGLNPSPGVLPINFTQPQRNFLAANDSNSWDLAGQSTFSVQVGIAAGAVNPTLIGIMEFDYLRNVRTDTGGAQAPFLQPVSQHQFIINGAAGRNDIVILPFDYPISRLWISSGAGNNITLLEIYQDGNKIIEGTPAELNEGNADYGILVGGANPFETAAVFDQDGRWWKSLKCANSFNVRVTLAAADTINIVQETLPGAYSS
jgi:coat protein